jgi:hypothetical protein
LWSKIIALPVSTSALNGVGVQLQTMAAIPLVKRTGAHYTAGQVVYRAGLEFRGKQTFSFTQRVSNSKPSS